MLKSVNGVYRDGRIELAEPAGDVPSETPVIVTFLEGGEIDLASRGIDRQKAAELRLRLSAFADDWESPEMDIYDNYDAAKERL